MDFQLNLVVTEKCNLACKYCYMHNNPKQMTKKVVSEVYKKLPTLLSFFNSERSNVIYFGGEPLINLDIIKYSHDMIKKNKNIINNEILISNMLLIDDNTINWLKEENVGISWSFDGLWNEDNRPLVDGSSSLEEYLNKLDTIKKISTGCKCMISPQSVSTINENVDFFINNGINYIDYSIVRDNIWTDNDVNNFEIEINKLVNKYSEYLNDNKNIVIDIFFLPILDMIFGKTVGKRPFGCFVGYNGLAVMPNGDMYPCARFGTNKKYCYGNIFDDISAASFDEINTEVYINPVEIEKCKSCKLYNYCNAGCSYCQLENDKEPLESVCKLYHIIYIAALKLNNMMKNNSIYKDIIRMKMDNVG